MTQNSHSDASKSPAPPSAAGATPPRKRKRRRLKIVLGGVVVLVLLVALAPTILSLGVGRASILSAAGDKLGLPLAADGWSLSWFGSQEVRGLAVRLPEGATVATVGRATIDQGLLSLIADSTHIGKVRIEQGELWSEHLGKAIEILKKLPSEKPPGPEKPPLLPESIELKTIVVHAAADTVTLQDGSLLTQPDGGQSVKFTAELKHAGESGQIIGSADLTGLTAATWHGWDAVGVKCGLTCKTLPLAPLYAVITSLQLPTPAGAPPLHLDGGGTVNVRADFSGTADGTATIKAWLDGHTLWLTGTPLKDDRPELDSLTIEVDACRDKQGVMVKKFDLDSPVAHATLSGAFPATASGTAAVAASGLVQINLAPLAHMLPHTLSLQKGLSITDGMAMVRYDGSWDARQVALKLNAYIENLKGTRDGKPVALSKVNLDADVQQDTASLAATATLGASATSATASARMTASATGSPAPPDLMTILKGTHVKVATLTGPFGSVKAAGRLEEFTLDAALDLARADSEIAQFVDLQGYSASGSAVAHMETKGSLDKGVTFALTSTFTNLKANLGKAVHLDEPVASVTGSGHLEFSKVNSEPTLASATLQSLTVDASGVHAEARGEATRTAGPWTVHSKATVNGQVVRLANLANLFAQMAGTSEKAPETKAGAAPAAPAAKTWRDMVADVARCAAGSATTQPATGLLTLALAADGSLAGGLKMTLDAGLNDSLIDFGTSGEWREPAAGLNLAASLTFAPAKNAADSSVGTLTAASLEKLTLTSAAGTVVAAAAATHKDNSWTWSASVTGDGDVASAARFERILMDLQTGGLAPAAVPAPAAGKPADLNAADRILDLMRRAAGVGTAAGQGRWHLQATADGDSARSIHVLERVTLADVFIPGDPVRVAGTAMARMPGAAPVTDAPSPATAVMAAGAAPSPAASTPAASASSTAPRTTPASTAVTTVPAAIKPFRLASAVFTCDSRYDYAPQQAVTITNLHLAVPGLTADVGGFTALPAAGSPLVFRGKVDATATADVAALADLLAPLGLMPPDPTGSGMVALKLSAKTDDQQNGRATFSVSGTNLNVAWLDGRRLNEPALVVEFDSLLRFDAKYALTKLDACHLRVQTAEGTVVGTGVATSGEKAWSYSIQGHGEGAVEPLAATVAAIQGKPVSAIRGNWKIDSGVFTLDSNGSMAGQGSLLASGLAIPQAATGTAPAGPDIRLADAKVTFDAAMDKAGAIQVRKADITGPGLHATATGTGRVPTATDTTFSADGTVTLKADLEELAQTLRPFGILPADVKLAGTADFDGKVATSADGVTGSGTLDLAALNLVLKPDDPAIVEPKMHVPVVFSYKPREKRWDVTADKMTSSLLAGTIRMAYIQAEPVPSVTAQCGISFDAGRVGTIIKPWLPADLQVAGAWTLRASVAGPLKSGVAWNEQLAPLASEGIMTVGRVQYQKVVAGNGTVHWKLAGGKLDLNPVPAEPSRLTVAGGPLNLAGVVELGSPVPILVISQPLKLVDVVPLSDPGLQDYLKFASPVIGGGNINPAGTVSVEIASLTLPLAAEEWKKMTGAGSFTIDKFQTTLSGPLGWLSEFMLGVPSKGTPVQQFGPVKLSVANGQVTLAPHSLTLAPDATMDFRGTIGFDEKMNVEIQLPVTQAMLQSGPVSALLQPLGISMQQVAPTLLKQKLFVPLTGTISKPQLDQKAVAKRIGDMVAEEAKKAVGGKLLEGLPDLLKGLKK